jgi:hypothetical protein
MPRGEGTNHDVLRSDCYKEGCGEEKEKINEDVRLGVTLETTKGIECGTVVAQRRARKEEPFVPQGIEIWVRPNRDCLLQYLISHHNCRRTPNHWIAALHDWYRDTRQ